MTVVPLRPDRIEVWSGTFQGSTNTRWFIERIEPGFDDGYIVHDTATEAEAIADAQEWGVPVVVRR